MSSQYIANFSPLTSEIGSGVWGTPANFNGFRVLPLLLQRRRSPDAKQTLHDVWPSPGLVHYIYIFGGSCPLMEFCPVQYSLYVQVLRSFNFERWCLYIDLHVCSTIITSLSHRSLCYQLTVIFRDRGRADLHRCQYRQRYCTALQQRASAKLCSVVQGMELRNFRIGRHIWPGRHHVGHQPTL